MINHRAQALRELRAMPPLCGVDAKDDATRLRREELVSAIEAGVRDPSYVCERNALIPSAEAATTAKGFKPGTVEWDREFLAGMDRAWKAKASRSRTTRK